MFDSAAPLFQESLNKSGYQYKLNFNPPAEKNNENKKSKKRNKRNVLWFNPSYNMNVKTNIGKEFLKLIDKFFSPGGLWIEGGLFHLFPGSVYCVTVKNSTFYSILNFLT